VQLIRFRDSTAGPPRVGVQVDEVVTELSGVSGIGALLRLPTEALRARLESADGPRRAAGECTVLPPVDGLMEVWAAGVTYRRSREARVAESDSAPDLYQRVYQAERPELFFKSTAAKVSGDGEPIALREDSEIDVPEPELALVISAAGEVVGYTVCNDVSSRSIEGENPLYLPQAKVWLGACAVGPAIRPAWEVSDPYDLTIRLSITRDGTQVWHGEASTGQLHRRLDELLAYHRRADVYPDGSVLSTGTCLVPELPFTLRDGDEVRIDIDTIGTLTNPVVRGLPAMNWLATRLREHAP
jgi:2-dehydro-3-deoxy-D-arabinonate dehydratase